MKEVVYKKKFIQQYTKLPTKIQKKFDERLDILKENPRHPLLRVHTLHGDRKPYKSMNITGNYRALFVIEGNEVIFSEIGTHSELY